ncbi:MAG: precorrin-6y C5,15-methyltransferase (decarboxylating) subunit CbiE [Paracoccus sp. (in: a-proteobacteria)]|nr:precorrin-6y C5,15-methyltransferase (decarboxylating) subunit CbiE [Paracoccus sp. (in: a-proteobacteria)]
MADPWLTIIGIGEDGPDGLPPASLAALQAAEIVTGAARHLALLPELSAELREWPVPWTEGVAGLLAMRGRRVVMLASGDPFWFGAGASLAPHLAPGEWRAMLAPSTFSLAAAAMGWRLEDCACLGLHAAPLSRMRPHLAPGARLIVLLRDGQAVAEAAAYLDDQGFGASRVSVLESLGGPHQRITATTAAGFAVQPAHPVALAVEVAGGPALSQASGRADALFEHDGQITKRPVRALTLSALAPVAGELLWDIGAGSGSIGIEWLLCHPANRAIAIEADGARAARIERNARAMGQDRLRIVNLPAPEGLAGLPRPDAVFIGGGLSDALLAALEAQAKGARLVANAVTIASQSRLAGLHELWGGEFLRVDLARAARLGGGHTWRPALPIVQFSTVIGGVA